jgi:hypothetical protein
MRSISFFIAAALALVLGVVLVATADAEEMKKSLYRGKHFDPTLSDCRGAIGYRESRFNYRAANPTSSARGFYQFLDSKWRESLVHMLRKEVRENYPEKLERLEQLNDVSIHRWPVWFQDAAFYTVVVGHDGIKHWAPVPSACR